MCNFSKKEIHLGLHTLTVSAAAAAAYPRLRACVTDRLIAKNHLQNVPVAKNALSKSV